MSRLDSFIRRLEAQRACLDHAVALVRGRAGPALELGLGNGRSFDHLRTRMPERPIHVIEREPNPHPLCRPPDGRLHVGELEALLPRVVALLGAPPVLVHSDIGTGDATRNQRVAGVIAALLPDVLAPDAVVISDQALASPHLAALALPDGVAPGRYFLYRLTRARA
jgi:hypothetical protein